LHVPAFRNANIRLGALMHTLRPIVDHLEMQHDRAQLGCGFRRDSCGCADIHRRGGRNSGPDLGARQETQVF
jgi:hypothetical protein